jgi:hypothetical protein
VHHGSPGEDLEKREETRHKPREIKQDRKQEQTREREINIWGERYDMKRGVEKEKEREE